MTPVSPIDRPTYDQAVNHARAILGAAAFETACADGRTLSQDQAVALTRADQRDASEELGASDASVRATGSELTRRQREVAFLVGVGLTNSEIANRLVISERTVEGHVAQIMARLDMTRRAQIAVWAVKHGLGT